MIFDITRLTKLAGQDFTNPKCRVRSPHITARESIEIGDYIVAQQKRIGELEQQVEFEMEQKAIAREQRNKVTNSLHNLKLLLGEDE